MRLGPTTGPLLQAAIDLTSKKIKQNIEQMLGEPMTEDNLDAVERVIEEQASFINSMLRDIDLPFTVTFMAEFDETSGTYNIDLFIREEKRDK